MPLRKNQIQDMPNKRYFDIIIDIVKDQYVAKLLKWVQSIDEQHKKGLRALKAIIDMKGNKRFKPLA